MLLKLRGNPGRPSLASLQDELAKLELIRRIDLPSNLFDQTSPRDLERCRRRVSVEAPHELRRHPDAARLTWLAAFVYLRARTLTDDLVDLLIETIHQIGARAERKVERELLEDLKRVTGKQNLLFELADAALAQPDGVVRDVVFPVVGEQTLRDLVKEWKATGPTYRITLRTVIRNSYRGHYRRMVPKLLDALEFRSNNERHRPVMQALELVKRFADSKVRTYPADEEVPLDGVVRGLWREAVVEKDASGQDRVNRITYEIAVLEALREQLRCKEIWVVGANRYRNPDEDLPADFDVNRDDYYQALGLPLDAERFTTELQAEMHEALDTLDAGLKKNRQVRISSKGGGWITLTPLDAQPDPPNLTALKAELNAIWPMTSLLDMVKETDLRLGFTEILKSPTAYEALERSVLQPRLLLCLHGIGTNAGLQRMASLDSGASAKDLAYVRRRYISVDALRRAVAIVADGTLRARNPAVWGAGTTACASDSKHFGAWDQNLTTQWHVRYGGRGVMIYWHVERNSLCIHSQLKSPSSSEVASMIEDVIIHTRAGGSMKHAVGVVTPGSITLPKLFAPDPNASKRFVEFFTANIRNPNTRKAYARDAAEFARWCEREKLHELQDIEPVHVAAYIETLQTRLAPPSVKQHLAAIRMLFDWLVVGQVLAVNPASPVRGPKYVVKKGKTPVLSAEEARALLDSIPPTSPVNLRDRALIALMVYTFARVGAALKMRVEDVYIQNRRSWVRLHEKGGKRHEMPCHHNLDTYLHTYIEEAHLAMDPKGFLFRTAKRRSGQLTDQPMSQPDAYRMTRRRAAAAGILTKVGNHSFRATGITEYLKNGGKLEIAQQMANHESARTTGLYDRRNDEIALDEVERILI